MIYRPGRETILGHVLIPRPWGLFEARVAATSEHSLKLKLDQAGLGQTATDTLSQLAAISE